MAFKINPGDAPPPTPLSRTFGRLAHTGKGGTLGSKVEEVPLPSPPALHI